MRYVSAYFSDVANVLRMDFYMYCFCNAAILHSLVISMVNNM